MAVGIDNSNYITNVSGLPNTYPSPSQFMYTMAADQPNMLSYFSHDANGPGPPSTGQVFAFLFNYLGSPKTSPEGVNYQSHWEGNALNSLAGSSYNPNNISLGLAYVYGTQTWDTAIYYILNPPTKQLITVCAGAWTQSGCSKSYNSGSGQWTLTWNLPAGVTQYLLKENDILTIVESIPWNETTNEPVVGNAAVASTYPWAASSYTAAQPSVKVNSISVAAPNTASFMLKAYANP